MRTHKHIYIYIYKIETIGQISEIIVLQQYDLYSESNIFSSLFLYPLLKTVTRSFLQQYFFIRNVYMYIYFRSRGYRSKIGQCGQ